MIEKITFLTRQEVNIEKKKRLGEWCCIHTDFIDDKFVLTFVNGKDDPNNSIETQNIQAKFERQNILTRKLQDNSMTFEDMKEYMRF